MFRNLKNLKIINIEEINKPKIKYDTFIEDYVCENCNAVLNSKKDKRCWCCKKKLVKFKV